MAEKEKPKQERNEELQILKQRIAELETECSELRTHQQSAKRFETVVRDSNDAIIMQDLDGRITAWNRGAEIMYGYRENEMLGKNIDVLTPADKAAEQKAFTRRLLAGEVLNSFDTQRVTKDGKLLDVWLTVTKITEHPADSIISTGRDITREIGITFVERNITERKKAEESLRQGQRLFRELIDHMSSGVAVYEVKDDGEDFIFKDINKAAERSSKLIRDQVVGKSVLQVFPGAKELGLFEVFRQVWKTGDPQRHPVSRYQDERIIQWVENYVYKLPSGEIVAIYDDVSERMKAEEALKNREMLLNVVGIIAKIGGWEMDLKEAKHCGQRERTIFEIGYDEPIPGFHEHADYYLPEYRDMIRKEMDKLVETKQPMKFEAAFKTANGKFKWCRAIGEAVVKNGRVIKLKGTLQDITERKKAEESLTASEKKFKAIFENSTDGIVITDLETKKFEDANESMCRLLGYSLEELKALGVADIHPKEKLPYIVEQIEAQSKDAHVPAVDLPVLRKNRQNVDCYVLGAKMNLLGKNYMVAVFRDITERRDMEEALKSNESLLKGIITAVPIGLGVASNRTIEWTNDYLPSLIGRRQEEIIGKNSRLFYESEEGFLDVGSRFYADLKAKGSAQMETVWKHKDGRKLNIYLTGVPLPGEDISTRIVFGALDITARKKSEEAVAFSNLVLRTQQEASIDGILVVDAKGGILSFNRRFVDLWGIPREVIETKSDEHTLESVMDKLASPEEFIRKVKHLYETRDEICSDEVVLKDGRTFDRYSAPMLGAEGKYYGRVWYFRDITERKKLEIEGRKRLKELEVFYKASMGREERIMELKEEVRRLQKELGK